MTHVCMICNVFLLCTLLHLFPSTGLIDVYSNDIENLNRMSVTIGKQLYTPPPRVFYRDWCLVSPRRLPGNHLHTLSTETTYVDKTGIKCQCLVTYVEMAAAVTASLTVLWTLPGQEVSEGQVDPLLVDVYVMLTYTFYHPDRHMKQMCDVWYLCV